MNEDQQSGVTPDEAAASLALATQFQETMMPQAPVAQEMALQEGENPEQPQDTEQPKEADIEALVEAKVEEKMADLRDELKSALDEEDNKEDDQED